MREAVPDADRGLRREGRPSRHDSLDDDATLIHAQFESNADPA